MNLIEYRSNLKIKPIGGKPSVWDVIRSKWIIITPEEIVRQCILHYLILTKGYRSGVIAVEKKIKYHQLSKRFDIVVYDQHVKPHILIECKAPHIAIDQPAVEQLLTYQEVLKAPYIWLSNGHQQIICRSTDTSDRYEVINDLPDAV